MPVDGQVRVGGNTKALTAVTVLRLVGEGEIVLDEPAEADLPGVVRGDGRNITVRQILQHTSGLPNYTNLFAQGLLPYQHTSLEPHRLLAMAFSQKATFAPGTNSPTTSSPT
ncbi:hypothetical protein Airi02_090840 [Actinoallomurus iriomotensis]|uniref:Beta-lactamase-related domain-containing protein n=1 Tax=Actinoallomurus iriomotensis TaxID=478107 RepID=A0A9W6SA77_9ACTN|nr:hypothetical protein Airi02_090840 [Actinoallomurus iriomotensis]